MIAKLLTAGLFAASTNTKSASTQSLTTQLQVTAPQQEGNAVDLKRRLALQNLIAASTVVLCTTTAGTVNALSADEASVAYDSYAPTYDDLDGGKASSALGLDDARAELFSKAQGKVLEIGVGTGLNLAKYDKSRVSSLTVVDISEGMIEEARAKASNLDIPVEFIKADATTELTKIFGSDTFDTVVDSFSLCVMGNEGARNCLAEMTNVVKKSGRILLLENSRSSSAVLGWYQDVTANAAASTGGKGCVYNQDVASMISKTNSLKIEKEKEYVAGLFRSFECIKNSY